MAIENVRASPLLFPSDGASRPREEDELDSFLNFFAAHNDSAKLVHAAFVVAVAAVALSIAILFVI